MATMVSATDVEYSILGGRQDACLRGGIRQDAIDAGADDVDACGARSLDHPVVRRGVGLEQDVQSGVLGEEPVRVQTCGATPFAGQIAGRDPAHLDPDVGDDGPRTEGEALYGLDARSTTRIARDRADDPGLARCGGHQAGEISRLIGREADLDIAGRTRGGVDLGRWPATRSAAASSLGMVSAWRRRSRTDRDSTPTNQTVGLDMAAVTVASWSVGPATTTMSSPCSTDACIRGST